MKYGEKNWAFVDCRKEKVGKKEFKHFKKISLVFEEKGLILS